MPWPDMPKHLAKDAFFQRMEERYRDRDTAQRTLADLRNTSQPIPLIQIGSVGATVADKKLDPTKMAQHFTQDWFDNNGGWWKNWKGDAEGTLRELLRRALEVSLGLKYTDAVSTAPGVKSGLNDPNWPIEFFWICGLPRFEGYISWNPGLVTVILLTPGYATRPGSPFVAPAVQDFLADPPADLDTWCRAQGKGIIFVGQNVLRTNGPFVEMAAPIIVHSLDYDRGGVGVWPRP